LIPSGVYLDFAYENNSIDQRQTANTKVVSYSGFLALIVVEIFLLAFGE
jgi:hypothetical protein